MIAETFEHSGLARPHFAGQQNEAFAALNAVYQTGERFLMLFTAVKKRGIGTEIKRAAR
jgi:hypothetical protein